VALGEAHFGAGQGDAIMAYLTVSTGVGGARIVDGHIDRSTFGFEPGHQFLDVDRTPWPDLVNGEAGELISGTATERRFGMKPYKVTDPAVWEELARLTAYMLANTIMHWSPNTVVLGGSMIVGDPAIPIDRIEHYLSEVLTIFPERPLVKKATLGACGGLYGAMTVVKQNMA
jgi:predicted NBD/HSP70 family sugar kinase